jgi:hypothetical protein
MFLSWHTQQGCFPQLNLNAAILSEYEEPDFQCFILSKLRKAILLKISAPSLGREKWREKMLGGKLHNLYHLNEVKQCMGLPGCLLSTENRQP